MEPVILECQHLKLVPPTANHVQALWEAAQNPELSRWTGYMPHPCSEEQAAYYVESVVGTGWENGTSLGWAVHVKDRAPADVLCRLSVVPADAAEQTPGHEGAGRFAGMVTLHRVDGFTAEIGYWAVPEARGQGYVTRACELVLGYAFTPTGRGVRESPEEASGLGLGRISWQAMVGNEPSAAVARRLGFRYEGLLRRALPTVEGEHLDCWQAGLLRDDPRGPVGWHIDGVRPEHSNTT